MIERTKQPDSAVATLLLSGFVAVPSLLLQTYKQLGLSDEEMMLLLHLIEFRQQGIEFPTFRQLGERMTLHEDMLQTMTFRLIQSGFLGLEENGRPGQEAYNLSPLYEKLGDILQPKPKPGLSSLEMLEKREQNLFSLFENEFGRPLSPLEYEKIVRWIDEDQYREDLIREALNEAVLSGKFNFKYIDRILFEWGKQNIRTLQELNVYREQFRNRVPSSRGGSSASKSREKAPDKKPEPAQENKYDAFYKMYGRD